MANYFYAIEDEKEDIVVVALRDIAPDEELLYYCNFDGAAAVPGAVDVAETELYESVDDATEDLQLSSERERDQVDSGGAPSVSDLQPQTNTAVPAMTVEEQNLMHHGDNTSVEKRCIHLSERKGSHLQQHFTMQRCQVFDLRWWCMRFVRDYAKISPSHFMRPPRPQWPGSLRSKKRGRIY